MTMDILPLYASHRSELDKIVDLRCQQVAAQPAASTTIAEIPDVLDPLFTCHSPCQPTSHQQGKV